MQAMFRVSAVVVAAATLWVATPDAQRGQKPAPEVTADVIVQDRDGQPVVGLRPEDFRVREDGRDVKVTNFRAVTPAEAASRSQGRSAVLILDDTGMRPEQTVDTQKVAEHFLKQAQPTDTLAVLRFSQARDEIAGARNVMAMRVAEFVGGARPFRDPDSYWEALRYVASVASDLFRLPGERRRHAIIWVGEPALIDIREPPERQFDQIWPRWLETVVATSRAMASVYAIHPQRGQRFDPDGVPAQTGGTVNELRDPLAGVEKMWNELGYYYLLTYTPPRTGRDLYEIDVRVSKPDVRVRARRARG